MRKHAASVASRHPPVHEAHDQRRREHRQLPLVHPQGEHRGKGEPEHRDGFAEGHPEPRRLDPACVAALPAPQQETLSALLRQLVAPFETG